MSTENARQELVNFYGDQITAIKDTDGEIYAVANEILRNIGFDTKKSQNQTYTWSKDIVISKGTKILVAQTNGGKQRSFCLSRKILPLALAKISITPTMQREQPEIVNKLIRYQMECADVLYKHFNKTDVTVLPLSREEAMTYIIYTTQMVQNTLAAINNHNKMITDLITAQTKSAETADKKAKAAQKKAIIKDWTAKIDEGLKMFDSCKGNKSYEDIRAEIVASIPGIDTSYANYKEKGGKGTMFDMIAANPYLRGKFEMCGNNIMRDYKKNFIPNVFGANKSAVDVITEINRVSGKSPAEKYRKVYHQMAVLGRFNWNNLVAQRSNRAGHKMSKAQIIREDEHLTALLKDAVEKIIKYNM